MDAIKEDYTTAVISESQSGAWSWEVGIPDPMLLYHKVKKKKKSHARKVNLSTDACVQEREQNDVPAQRQTSLSGLRNASQLHRCPCNRAVSSATVITGPSADPPCPPPCLLLQAQPLCWLPARRFSRPACAPGDSALPLTLCYCCCCGSESQWAD